MKKVPYGCDNYNLFNMTSVKYYLLRAFSENLKQLSSILTNIWRLEASYAILFGTLHHEGLSDWLKPIASFNRFQNCY